MKTKFLMAMLTENLKTVAVQFKDYEGEATGGHYTYKTDLELTVGDEVIVKSPSTGFTVAVVSEVHNFAELDETAEYEYKWVVQKVDAEGYKARLEEEDKVAKELAVIQGKAKRSKVIANLKTALGLGEGEESKELDELLTRLSSK